MFWVNKVVGFFVNPLMVGMGLIGVAVVLGWLKRRGVVAFGVAALVWFWMWSTPQMFLWLGGWLEAPYPPVVAEEMPEADAIVILGGGMGCNTNMPYAEMFQAADRVWHGARLYRAGRARLVIPSGRGDEHAVVPLLLDLGVPREAVVVESGSRNTTENALLTEELIRGLPGMEEVERPRVLLVTSAWHMRRSVMNFARTNLEVIPAATDHETMAQRRDGWSVKNLLPNFDKFYANSVYSKEMVGLVGVLMLQKQRGRGLGAGIASLL